jgi:hypothetical protein
MIRHINILIGNISNLFLKKFYSKRVSLLMNEKIKQNLQIIPKKNYNY